jgi:hypothetical protein
MNISFDHEAARQIRARALERDATRFLRTKGFGLHGEKKKQDPSQIAFERLLIRTPTGGKPGRRL